MEQVLELTKDPQDVWTVLSLDTAYNWTAVQPSGRNAYWSQVASVGDIDRDDPTIVDTQGWTIWKSAGINDYFWTDLESGTVKIKFIQGSRRSSA